MPDTIKTAEHIGIMREGGRLLAGIMERVKERAVAGARLNDLDRLAHDLMRTAGGTPSFLGYRPAGATKTYSASICASVNDTVVHGVPNAYALADGDVLKLDFGFFYKGFHTDAAFTIGIGTISPAAERLIGATRRALAAGIRHAREGNTLGDIGNAIETTVRTSGFHIADQLTGHGIGTRLHEDPHVFNTGMPGKGMRLVPGMVLALEPMAAIGTSRVVQQNDDSFVTVDGSIAAHFEHTIAITKSGPEILTQ
ncbi:MAG: type I methionyl aminopeptidase [Candidatus Liptonbacteria bacterium]|nr:type I methionyl aminopeptidase [Candidatus Liptonbacteria bacterium]